MSTSNPLEVGDELTIPSRTVKTLHPINDHIDGHQETQRTPKAGNDNETVSQAPPAPRHILSCISCFFIIVADSPEANDSEGI